MAIESLTRRQLKKIYDEIIFPFEKKFDRKNCNIEKIKEEFANTINTHPDVIHVLCLRMLAEHFNKTIDEMLAYNLIFLDSSRRKVKLVSRSGQKILEYSITPENHLVCDDIDLGNVDI